MIEFLIPFITGFIVTLFALLVGYKLGKDQTIVTDDTKKKIKQIFNRVVPDSDIGIIQRPDAQQNHYRDNPKAKTEDDVMVGAIERLNHGQA